MGERLLTVTTISHSGQGVVEPQPIRVESRYLFLKELSQLAYAFGDEKDPRIDTLQLLECYMAEYVKDLLSKAQIRSNRRGQPRLEIIDIMHYLKDHPKQYHRVKQLQKQMSAAKKIESIKKYCEEDTMTKKKKTSNF